MKSKVNFIGFGEAGQAFAGADDWSSDASAFDIQTTRAETRAPKLADYEHCSVSSSDTLAEAVAGADAIISVVTADQALPVAQDSAAHLRSGQIFLDFNSVAPDTKRQAARCVEQAGADYVDVAVMAPVHPKRLNTPLLLSGRRADDALEHLAGAGFANLRVVGDEVGKASSIKMVRSIMIKGMEALRACCAMSAVRAGVLDEVVDSLGAEWLDKTNYSLDRMLKHGNRRAAEMEEVTATIEALGVDSGLIRATTDWQRMLSEAGAGGAPEELEDRLALLADLRKAAAE